MGGIRKRFSHWSLQYAMDKILYRMYTWRNPDAPWLTEGAVHFLGNYLFPSDVGFEWGSGRSTIWFASRVGKLYSVEHNIEWFNWVKERIDGISDVTLYYRELPSNSNVEYIEVINEACDDNSLSFCLIDGRARDLCAEAAAPKIKPGGLLIIDDAERYFPTNDSAPGSKSVYRNARWERLHKITLEDWRSFWFSNGISITGIFIKPCI